MYWKLTDTYEMGYEYECPKCGKHIDVRQRGTSLPEECPYCKANMKEVLK